MAEQEAKQTTLVNLILDKSGSMGSVRDDTIGGFNTYIQTLKQDKSECKFSLTMFDTIIYRVHVVQNLDKIPELSHATYVPGGNTALNDAIGDTIRAVEKNLSGITKVLTVIMTDGQENSSVEFKGAAGKAAVKALIQEKEALGNWTFVFMGAGLDAWDTGGPDAVGIPSNGAVRQCLPHRRQFGNSQPLQRCRSCGGNPPTTGSGCQGERSRS